MSELTDAAPIVVQLSGGVASWAAGRIAIDANPNVEVRLLFADTMIEDEDLYRFLLDVEVDLGRKVERIADGRDPWQVFEDRRYIGNSRVDPCSMVLKRKLLRRWLDEQYPDGCRVVVGIDWTESHRVDRIAEGLLPHLAEFPLIDAGLDKIQAFEMLDDAGIRRPRLYDLGFSHNNCGGFCIKAGQAQFARLRITMPGRYAMHAYAEARLRRVLGKNVSILRDRRMSARVEHAKRLGLSDVPNAVPMTLFEFSGRVIAGEFDRLDEGGCGCAVDDGSNPSQLTLDLFDAEPAGQGQPVRVRGPRASENTLAAAYSDDPS